MRYSAMTFSAPTRVTFDAGDVNLYLLCVIVVILLAYLFGAA
jgi:hypothetical protein